MNSSIGRAIARVKDSDVQKFAVAHQGRGWHATSLYGYHFKDTGEWCWVIRLRRKNWMEAAGERYTTLFITMEGKKLCARPAAMHRFSVDEVGLF